jgi:hypothetical protein
MILDDPNRLLAHWQNFYVIAGAAGAQLTAIQFVVISLIAQRETGATMREIRAFGTPTVVHFCVALLISAMMSAPWGGLFGVSVAIGLFGVAGVAYIFRVIGHARRQKGYAPDAEDWFWYVALPLVTYFVLLWPALALRHHPNASLFVVASMTLSLLVIGIHNAWDTITYITTKNRETTTGNKT